MLMNPKLRKSGFTLIETLVTLLILSILTSLILPVVISAREASRKSHCANNLKQIGLALHQYFAIENSFPPFSVIPKGITYQPWSAHARILPFLEKSSIYNQINWSSQQQFTANPTVAAVRIQLFLCPSEINQQPHITSTLTYYPVSYSWNQGTWFTYDPLSNKTGNGAFLPNKSFTDTDFHDGLSNTLAMAETKTFQAMILDTRQPGIVGAEPPSEPKFLLNYLIGGVFDSYGHTEWVKGELHETGFTTTLPPNTNVFFIPPGLNRKKDIDYVSMRDGESLTIPTYGAVSSRSYHSLGVNTLFMNGSVRFIKNGISKEVWRALGTRESNDLSDLERY